MRERIAIMVCVLTLVAAVACALIFSVRHNAGEDARLSAPEREMNPAAGGKTNRVLAGLTNTPSAPTNSVEATVEPKTDDVAGRGQEIFEANRCSGCHSIGGTGNPRSPLDGVGARRTKEALVDWITGTGTAAESLPAGVVRRKQRYSDLPPGDLTAMVEYLSTLKPGATQESDGLAD